MAEERLTEDPLFLACTRPAMVLGVPMEAMGVNVILSGVVFLVGGSLRLRRRGPSQHDQVPIASKVGLPTDKEGEEHVAVIPMMLEHKEMDLEADMWWRQNAQLQMHQEHNLMPMSQRRHKYLCQRHG